MRKQGKKKKVFNITLTQWDMAAQRYLDHDSFAQIGRNFGVTRQRAFQQVQRVREVMRRA